MIDHKEERTSTAEPAASGSEQGERRYGPAMVRVLLQPEEKMLELPRPKTARQLLAALGLREETALVAREGELLTPDRRIFADDQLLVRTVTSSG